MVKPRGTFKNMKPAQLRAVLQAGNLKGKDLLHAQTQLQKKVTGPDVTTGSDVSTGDQLLNKGATTQGGIDAAMSEFLRQIIGGSGATGLDFSGAPQISSEGDLEADRAKTEAAIYGDLTQNLARDRSRDVEAQKQELADRGILYTPGDAESGYGQAVGGVNERYDSREATARNQARIQSTGEMSTILNNQLSARNAFVNEATQKAQFPLAALGALSGSSQLNTLLQSIFGKYGIDVDAATKKEIAGMAGAGEGENTDPIFGNQPPVVTPK